MLTLKARVVIGGLRIALILIAGLTARTAWCDDPVEKPIPKPDARATATEDLRRAAKLFEKHPDKFVKAIIAFLRAHSEEISKRDIGGFAYIAGAASLLERNAQLARAELVKYLRVDEQGNLKVGLDLDDDAIVAYMLLWILDTNPNNVPPAYPDRGNPPFELVYREELAEIPIRHAANSYKPMVQSYKGSVPHALVEYLFMLSPVCAWRCLADYETRIPEQDFTWTVHVLATTAWRIWNRKKEFAELDLARKELQKLVNDSAWYSRRFAVHVLLSYPYLGTPELVKKLQNDPHPLVSERAKALSVQPRDKE